MYKLNYVEFYQILFSSSWSRTHGIVFLVAR